MAQKRPNPLEMIYQIMSKFVSVTDLEKNLGRLSSDDWEKYHPKHTQAIVNWINENIFGIPLEQLRASLSTSLQGKENPSKTTPSLGA